jgi:hypothetical protein
VDNGFACGRPFQLAAALLLEVEPEPAGEAAGVVDPADPADSDEDLEDADDDADVDSLAGVVLAAALPFEPDRLSVR